MPVTARHCPSTPSENLNVPTAMHKHHKFSHQWQQLPSLIAINSATETVVFVVRTCWVKSCGNVNWRKLLASKLRNWFVELGTWDTLELSVHWYHIVPTEGFYDVGNTHAQWHSSVSKFLAIISNIVTLKVNIEPVARKREGAPISLPSISKHCSHCVSSTLSLPLPFLSLSPLPSLGHPPS